MKFTPAGDRVLAVRIEEPEPLILVPDAHREKSNRFRVVSQGPGRVAVGGTFLRQTEVGPGDVVLVDERALVVEIMLDGVEHTLFDSASILGILG